MSVSDFDPKAPATVECPYPFYQAMREKAPVYKPLGYDFSSLAVTTISRKCCSTPKFFPHSSRPAIGHRRGRSKL